MGYITVFFVGMLVGQWVLYSWTAKILAEAFQPEEE